MLGVAGLAPYLSMTCCAVLCCAVLFCAVLCCVEPLFGCADALARGLGCSRGPGAAARSRFCGAWQTDVYKGNLTGPPGAALLPSKVCVSALQVCEDSWWDVCTVCRSMCVACMLCCELAPHRLAVSLRLHLSGISGGRQADILVQPFSS